MPRSTLESPNGRIDLTAGIIQTVAGIDHKMRPLAFFMIGHLTR
jgi:hypothetical protein